MLQLQKMTEYVLGEEQDRNNRITNENNALNSRIKNYQEELLEREKDIERLRESRKKMEVELDHEKANTKVCHMISILMLLLRPYKLRNKKTQWYYFSQL